MPTGGNNPPLISRYEGATPRNNYGSGIHYRPLDRFTIMRTAETLNEPRASGETHTAFMEDPVIVMSPVVVALLILRVGNDLGGIFSLSCVSKNAAAPGSAVNHLLTTMRHVATSVMTAPTPS